MYSEFPSVKLKNAGEGGLLVVFDNKITPRLYAQVRSFVNALAKKKLVGIREIVPSYCSVMVYFDVLAVTMPEMKTLAKEALAEMEPEDTQAYRILHVPVCYEGVLAPDMEKVLRITGLTKNELLRIHTEKPFLVYTMGFSPGFPYMGDLPFSVPRLSSPRPVIPPGSVGLGGSQTGIYTVKARGEWQIIGRTPLKIFDHNRSQTFLLMPGDYVKFEKISLAAYFELRDQVAQDDYIPHLEVIEL
ncbi:MAG: 5-oxoprolinase subunit PxpB [Acidaminococcaceae bacterium]|jgi:inhibitor of KinA|nr:5-oxoprolinase subunit PxpB [Acidaminococcaceae bacterium]